MEFRISENAGEHSNQINKWLIKVNHIVDDNFES